MGDSKSTKILFIGCNYDQLPYLTELKARDYFIVGIDKNPDAPGRNLCDVFYEIGYDEVEAMIGVGESQKIKYLPQRRSLHTKGLLVLQLILGALIQK
jgi:hypothetical protein